MFWEFNQCSGSNQYGGLLCACGQQVVTTPPRAAQRCVRLLYMSLEEELGLFLYHWTKVSWLLFLCSVFSHFPNWWLLDFALWTQWRPRRLKPVSAHKKKDTKRSFCTQESPRQWCSISLSPFLWHTSIMK